MNQFFSNAAFNNELSNDRDPACGGLMNMAEQELTSFFSAVKELFGPEQAEISAEEWLHELMATDSLPASTGRLRQLTLKVSAMLASRLNTSSIVTSSNPAANRKLAYAS